MENNNLSSFSKQQELQSQESRNQEIQENTVTNIANDEVINPMPIEVPKDFYLGAKQSFIQMVERNPEQFGIGGTEEEIKKQAEKLANETIKKSPFTYTQLQNLNVQNQEIPGTIAGNLTSAENIADNVVMNGVRGHGFAAEKANHLHDVLSGKDSKLVGTDNAKNGADRFVDGQYIQTKFCNSGGKCISECFDDGNFRYWDSNGKPMQIEVPKDFYLDAKKSFAHRVEKSPEQFGIDGTQEEIRKQAEKLADETIKQSPYTYAQAKNIARFGTVESLTFDAVNGVRVAGTAMGISAVISFATSVWSGEDFDIALKNACYSGLKVGGLAWVSSIASAQIGRTGIMQSLRPATDWVVKQMGSKTAAALANTLRIGSKPIYGAAALNSASKLLRGNIVTGTITVGVLSSVDFYRMFQGRVSGAQVLKNVTNTATGVAGGTAGWMGGAAAGAALGSAIPIIGTAAGGIIGGVLGSLGGGVAANKASSMLLDKFVEDDAKKMQEVLGKVFVQLAKDYLLNQKEADNVLNSLQEKLSIDILRDMFAADSREKFATSLIEPIIENEVRKRPRISIQDLPSNSQLSDEIESILEENLNSSSEESTD